MCHLQRHARATFGALCALFLIAGAATAQSGADPSPGAEPAAARAELKNGSGATVGFATFHTTPNGTLLRTAFSALPPGAHAFHVHESGRCEGDFTSAGGHLNPSRAQHGFRDARGPHAGDLPNLHVPADGELTVANFADGVSLEQLLDADGSALVVHAEADDYRTDPAGAAGARIACGVVERVGAE